MRLTTRTIDCTTPTDHYLAEVFDHGAARGRADRNVPPGVEGDGVDQETDGEDQGGELRLDGVAEHQAESRDDDELEHESNKDVNMKIRSCDPLYQV